MHCLVAVAFFGTPCIGKIAAHSAYDLFSCYKYLIVNLVFSHLGFWRGNLFLRLFLFVTYLYLFQVIYWTEGLLEDFMSSNVGRRHRLRPVNM